MARIRTYLRRAIGSRAARVGGLVVCILLFGWLGHTQASNIIQSAYNLVKNGGSALTQRVTLNCGTGLTCTDDGVNNWTNIASSVSLPLSPANGGTGVNNGTSTLTLGGNTTFSGAFNPTFSIPANDTWTLPTANTTLLGGGENCGTASRIPFVSATAGVMNCSANVTYDGTSFNLTGLVPLTVTNANKFELQVATGTMSGSSRDVLWIADNSSSGYGWYARDGSGTQQFAGGIDRNGNWCVKCSAPTASSLTLGATIDLIDPNQKAATGQRFVCIDTNGKMISAAAACVGT